MLYQKLGKTDYLVSRICFGSLTVGPLQLNLPVEEGAKVIKYALERGINFIDTAQYYQNYEHIGHALKDWDKDVIIASKSYAYDQKTMKNAVEEARQKLNRDKIEIFLLHEQETDLTIKGHWEAVEYLVKAQAQNIVGKIGISTHAVAATKAAAEIDQFDIIHPMLNMEGRGIIDGNLKDMVDAVKYAHEKGKGIYGMKAFGGGTLLVNAEKALRWALNFKYTDSFALGMRNEAEIDTNIAWLLGEKPKRLEETRTEPRRLHIASYCTGCGNCIKRCQQKALFLVEGKARVNHEKCVVCGYCAGVCKEDSMKIY